MEYKSNKLTDQKCKIEKSPKQRDPYGLCVELKEKQAISCLGNGKLKKAKNPACLEESMISAL